MLTKKQHNGLAQLLGVSRNAARLWYSMRMKQLQRRTGLLLTPKAPVLSGDDYRALKELGKAGWISENPSRIGHYNAHALPF